MTPRRIGAVQAHKGASAVPLPLWRDRSSRRQLTSREVPLAVSMRAHACLLAPHHATTRAGHVDAGTLINRHHTKIQATHASLRRWHGGGAVCGGGVVTWHAVPPASPPCGSSAAVCPSSSMRGHLAPHVRVTPMLEPHQDGDGHRNPLRPLYRPRCRYLPRVSRRDGQHLHRALTRAEAQRLRSPPTMSVPSAGCRECRVRADDAALHAAYRPVVRRRTACGGVEGTASSLKIER